MCSSVLPPYNLITPVFPDTRPVHDRTCRQSQGILHSDQASQLVPREAALARGGLRSTLSKMTTTYQAPSMGPYDGHVFQTYPSTIAQGRSTIPNISEAVRPSQYARTSRQVASTYTQNQARDPGSAVTTASRHSTRPSTPTSDATASRSAASQGSGPQTLVHHSLQIPECINPDGGNLADFAAQITCLFWFESIETLRAAEKIRSRPSSAPLPRLTPHAIPYLAFKRWAWGVLSTTQVTQSVILLALLFVYRLKMTNPGVQGRSGSEYRLLTVALMLGNKFLDDNTYTNKTWAEVSGISVQEIHVMEVEFLSNMRYSLVATKTQWEDWLDKLACYSEYYNRALNQPSSPIAYSSPASQAFNSPLPSPTPVAQLPSTVNGLTNTAPIAFSPRSSSQRFGQGWASSGLQNMQASSPLSAKSQLYTAPRKRALDEDDAEPPAKRVSRQQPMALPPTRPPVVGGQQPIRLPVPSLTLNTNTATASRTPDYVGPHAPQPTQSHVSLPPLSSGMRAMSTVYGTPVANVGTVPSLPHPTVATTTTTAPGNIAVSQATLTPTSGIPVHAHMGFGTPGRRQSPAGMADFGSSPLGDMYAVASAVHTPISHTPMSHSPSVYLQQRQSPYKPIRHVNTLLCPPPSASLHEYHTSSVPPQMHYQPLGRRNDLRTGVVPEYMTVSYQNGQPMHVRPPLHGHGPEYQHPH